MYDVIIFKIEEIGLFGKFLFKFLERILNREKYIVELFDE